jgi:hypothetical protein
MKDVAKSLHTLTVIQQVAHLHMALAQNADAEAAVNRAMETLALAGRPDPYGLRARALALLTGGRR